MENFKVPWNVQNLSEYDHFYSNLLHGTVHHPTIFQANKLKFFKSQKGNVVPQTWSKPIMENFKVPWNAQKLAEHCVWRMAILNRDPLNGSI